MVLSSQVVVASSTGCQPRVRNPWLQGILLADELKAGPAHHVCCGTGRMPRAAHWRLGRLGRKLKSRQHAVLEIAEDTQKKARCARCCCRNLGPMQVLSAAPTATARCTAGLPSHIASQVHEHVAHMSCRCITNQHEAIS